MPRSFLLKRFSKPTGWMEGEEKLSPSEKGKQLEDTNNNPIKTREDSMQRWDATPEMTSNILYVGMEWNKNLNQGIIDNPNKHDFIHHMIYRDIPNPTRLNDDETFKQLNKPESNKKPTYKCNQCGRVFKTKYTLTIHLKMPSHTGARPFVCAICGKGFRLSSTLCRHKIIHTSHKPHRCQTCGKAFNRSSTLKTHQRTHSDTKEFACDICNKGFHQKGNLRNHLLIHSGEKPYKCNLCKKAFNKLSNLKFHMHIHTDNKPYRCRYCKDSFSRRCELKGHISTCSHNATDKASIDANTAEL